ARLMKVSSELPETERSFSLINKSRNMCWIWKGRERSYLRSVVCGEKGRAALQAQAEWSRALWWASCCSLFMTIDSIACPDCPSQADRLTSQRKFRSKASWRCLVPKTIGLQASELS